MSVKKKKKTLTNIESIFFPQHSEDKKVQSCNPNKPQVTLQFV